MGNTLKPEVQYDAALTDQGYRLAYRSSGGDQGELLGMPVNVIPRSIRCPRCGRRAPFQDDHMAARYECPCGHATAAMWADPTVAGPEALH